MALLNSLATDKQKELEGIWVNYPGTNAEFKIARLGNSNFQKYASRLSRSQIRKLTSGNIQAKEGLETIAPAIAKHIVLDWQNIEENDKNGKSVLVEYSVEKATEIFANEQYQDLIIWIIEESQSVENYRVENLKEQEKN